MKILDRVRLVIKRRERAALLSEDRAERDPSITTDAMMNGMVLRAKKIAVLTKEIREIERADEFDFPDDQEKGPVSDPPVPSDMFIPTQGKYK